MARSPLILALANPEPEILPPLAKEVRDDVIICTGRSDYPNQVNNVLCFPFIFRGALDVGATAINEEMKLAAVHAIAELAHADIERDAGARRLLVEDHRQHLVLEELRAIAFGQTRLQRAGHVEHAAQLGIGEIVDIKKMSRLGRHVAVL